MIELNVEVRIKKKMFFLFVFNYLWSFVKKKLKEREKIFKINIKILIGENLLRYKCNIGCYGYYLGEYI